MTIEDPIRATLREQAEAVTPTDRWERIETEPHQPPLPAGAPASRRLLAGVVAVVVFVVAGAFAWSAFREAPSATPSATQTATPRTGGGYHDAAGWDVRVPQGWYAAPFTLIETTPEQFVGVVISDTELPTPTLEDGHPKSPTLGGLQPTVTALSPTSAAVIIARTVSPRSGEVALPLSLDTLDEQRPSKGSLPVKSANFAAAGSTFLVTVTTGSEAPDASTLHIVDQILSSFRYPQPPTPSCLASQLVGRLIDSEGNAGTATVTFGLQNRSSGSCHVEGWPGIQALGPTGTQLLVHERTDFFDGLPRQPSEVTLRPGASALLLIAAVDIDTGSGCDAVKTFRITPSGAGGTVDVETKGGQICGHTIWTTPFTASYDLQNPSSTPSPGS